MGHSCRLSRAFERSGRRAAVSRATTRRHQQEMQRIRPDAVAINPVTSNLQRPNHMIRSTIKSLFLVLAIATAAIAQTSLNYGFVSPNRKENLKLADAIKGMNSTDETKLVNKSINMGCVVQSRIRAFRSLGSWSDGAEHSVMIRVQ